MVNRVYYYKILTTLVLGILLVTNAAVAGNSNRSIDDESHDEKWIVVIMSINPETQILIVVDQNTKRQQRIPITSATEITGAVHSFGKLEVNQRLQLNGYGRVSFYLDSEGETVKRHEYIIVRVKAF